MSFHVNDWVEVRSKEEILSSLDRDGRLDGLPFMPQMFQYCGKSFQVFKSAHKTCDTVSNSGGRELPQGIHLNLRCDGKAYGGCQAACLIFWKEVWLKPAVGRGDPSGAATSAGNSSGCSEEDVERATSIRNAAGEKVYHCQATRLLHFTKALPGWRLGQYLQDYGRGNVTVSDLFYGFVYSTYCKATRAYHKSLGRPGRWFYDWFQSLHDGIPYPRHRGTVPDGQSAPSATLNLQPGEMVRVKPYREILATLNSDNENRGLFFDAEMVPYCCGTYRVKARVEKFVDEKIGVMRSLKTPAVMLENVWCRSCYSNNRMFCPRSIYSWWREIWLERVEEPLVVDQTQVRAEADVPH